MFCNCQLSSSDDVVEIYRDPSAVSPSSIQSFKLSATFQDHRLLLGMMEQVIQLHLTVKCQMGGDKLCKIVLDVKK